MSTLIFVVAAYLIGSISFAVVVSKLMGLNDPRTFGSGNPGATNVLRSGKKLAALFTLLGDAGKGLAAVMLVRLLNPDEVTEAFVAIAVTVGHFYPIYFRFRGGKGVATAAGVLFALNWQLGLASMACWLLVAILSRYSSLAAITTAAFAPVAAWYLKCPDAMFAATGLLGIMLIARHKGNISALRHGNERKIGQKT